VETFGQALRRLRGGMSVRELARRAHLDAGHLSRIENGKRPPSPELALALDQALDAGGTLVALLAEGPAPPWRLDGGLWRPEDSERLATAAVAERPSAENAVALAHQWLIAEPPRSTRRGPAGGSAGTSSSR
jgi:transcriptional regulator with XRE-family HTH domain